MSVCGAHPPYVTVGGKKGHNSQQLSQRDREGPAKL